MKKGLRGFTPNKRKCVPVGTRFLCLQLPRFSKKIAANNEPNIEIISQLMKGALKEMPQEKVAQVHFRLSPVEKEKLISRASEAHMNLSDYIMHLSEQKRIVVVDELPDLINQIVKIGTNVNQIALVANTYKSVSAQQIEQLENELSRVRRALTQIIDIVNGTDNDDLSDVSSAQLDTLNRNQIETQRLLRKVLDAVGVSAEENED